MTRPLPAPRPAGPRDVPATGRVLVARMDNVGDVLLAEPAVRAVAAHASRVSLLAGPRGRPAAELLRHADAVIEWCAPWIDPEPPAVSTAHAARLITEVRREAPGAALILTSFHQSPLPLALLLRFAGVPWIGAISEDYPGSLLDLRHRPPEGVHESRRMLSLAEAAGYTLPPGDEGVPMVGGPLPDVDALVGGPGSAQGYTVVHAGASAPTRAVPWRLAAAAVARLRDEGRRVVLTGSAGDRGENGVIAAAARFAEPEGATGPPGIVDLAGRTGLGELAAVLHRADAVVTGNTGPAHLAAAVGTPVVSLFAPVVPLSSWGPHGVPVRVLGDQSAPCRDTRARHCPVPGHPCLNGVDPADIAHAVGEVEKEAAERAAPAARRPDDGAAEAVVPNTVREGA